MSIPRYPDINIDADCWPTYKDGRMLDDSMDGIESERLLWRGQRIARLTLIHPCLRAVEVDTLMEFYDANERTQFELDWRGKIIVCKFVGKPKPVAARGWWTTMSSTVREV